MSPGLFRRSLPRGLFLRSLLIIVMPVILVQAVVTYLLFDRQWDAVTLRISRAVAAQVVLFVQSYETNGPQRFESEAVKLRETSFGLVPVVRVGERIPQTDSPAYDVLKRVFTNELSTRINRPVWIDSYSHPDHVDIRIQLDGAVMTILAEKKRVMSTNTHVWVLWMIGTSFVFLGIAILFLRNQIRPIVRLADAAEAFGKGRDVPDFRPSGATEVRRAALAFIDMRERISRFVLLDHMDWMSSYHPQALAGGMAAHPGTRHARRPRAASQRSCQTALDRIRLACADGAAPLRQVLRFHNEWARELTRQDRVHTYAGFHIADLPG